MLLPRLLVPYHPSMLSYLATCSSHTSLMIWFHVVPLSGMGSLTLQFALFPDALPQHTNYPDDIYTTFQHQPQALKNFSECWSCPEVPPFVLKYIFPKLFFFPALSLLFSKTVLVGIFLSGPHSSIKTKQYKNKHNNKQKQKHNGY